MARKKDSKALFEVLSRTETTMSVPGWMKAKSAEDATTPAAETAESQKDHAPAPETEDEQAVSPDEMIDVEVDTEPEESETTEDEESHVPGEEIESDESEDAETSEEESTDLDVEMPLEKKPRLRWKPRLGGLPPSEKAARFSLNPRRTVIFIVIIGVLFLLAFVLGRLTAHRVGEGPASPRSGRSVPTAERRSVIPDDAPVTCVSGRRDPDRYFLIIETLRGNGDTDKAEAERIIAFCEERDLPADMVELQRGDQPRVAVWSLLGFRFANSKPALEHAGKAEQTGREYFAKYKTYTFRQRRRRDGSLRPFFVSGKMEQPVE